MICRPASAKACNARLMKWELGWKISRISGYKAGLNSNCALGTIACYMSLT